MIALFLSLLFAADEATPIFAKARGHARAITSVAFSPNGKLLASAGWDNKVRLWKCRGDNVKEWAVLKAGASGIAFSPDGKTLASGSAGTELILWDVSGPEPKKASQLPGHVNRPFAVAFARTGQHLASGCFDPVLRIWRLADGDWESWAILANERAPSLGISSLAFSPDGKILAAGHFAGRQSLRVWDISENLMLERELPQAQAHVVALAADNKTLAFAGDDARIRLWDLSTKPPAERVLQQNGAPAWQRSVLTLAFSPDGRTLATTFKNRTLVLWHVPTGKKRQTISFEDNCNALHFAPHGRTLAAGNADGFVYLVRIE